MGLGKALIIGFCVYLVVSVISFLLFVQLGLGYRFPNLANGIADILAFPFGTGKNYNLILSGLFWTVIVSIIIKIIGFYMKKQ